MAGSTIEVPSGTDGHRTTWIDSRLLAADEPARRTWHWPFVTAAIFIAAWWLAAAFGPWDELVLPGPGKVWDAFVQSVTVHDGNTGLSGEFLWVHLWASLRRILLGLAFGIAAGVPLGLFIGLSRIGGLLLGPAVDFLKALPPLGYFPLLLLWFGIEDTSKIWLLAIAALGPVTVATASGVNNIRHERVHAALVLGASRLDLIRTVVLPSIAGEVVTGIRLASGFAWTTIVAAETTNGLPGIGGLAWSSQKELRADVAILCVIVIGLTALLIDAVLKRVERLLVPWQGSA
jgi:taurine transport system permease protein